MGGSIRVIIDTRQRRGRLAAPLPGKALAVFEPALALIVELAPSPDA